MKYLTQLFISLWICSIAIAQDSRPNILLILIDDLRYDALGATGHPFFESPSIDRIANEGVLFENSFVVQSLCSPSRASIYTGMYPHIHGVVNNNKSLNHSEYTTIAEELHNSGYETAFIGKYQMGNDGTPEPGYDRWVTLQSENRFYNPIFSIDNQDTLIEIQGHVTDILHDFTLDFISSDHSTPFFVILSHEAVHGPSRAQEEFIGIFDSIDISLPETWGEDISSKPSILNFSLFNGDSDSLRHRTRNYYECLAGVEQSVGIILDSLEALGILDNTLVIFTSDNGFLLGAHTLQGKALAYEESIRVPLFIRYPAMFSPGLIVDDIVLNVDIMPTILEIAGIAPISQNQGLSLLDLATPEVNRNSFYYEFYQRANNTFPFAFDILSVRSLEKKYIVYPKTNEIEELYDLELDPIEAVNLFFDPSYDAVRDTMRSKLDSLRFTLGDTLMGIANLYIPDVEVYSGDTIDIPFEVDFPIDSLINRFSISLSGFSDELEYIGVRCLDSCFLRPAGSWHIEKINTDRLRINAWTDSSGINGAGTLFYLRAFIPDAAVLGTYPIRIESAIFNNGQFPVRRRVGQWEIITSITPGRLPENYSIEQNYPNPFNPSTTLSYGLPKDAHVSLVIYDILGKEVRSMESGNKAAGWYDVVWDGRNDQGQIVSTGIYLTRIRAGEYHKVIKMMYLK